MEQYDVFISHASEDKEAFVRPLANALHDLGVSVWYDEFALSLGDSLSRSIDRGLSQSRYGLVVLSPDFFKKNWPEYEFRGLTAKEMQGGKVILPIWYGVTAEEVVRWSPPLADKYALVAGTKSPLLLATEVLSVVRPDLATRVQRRMASLATRRTPQKIPLEKVYVGPHKHETLPLELLERIRLIRVALLDVFPHSMSHWVDGFRRDSHPSREVRIWERIACCYLEFCASAQPKDDERLNLFSTLLGLSTGAPDDDILDSPHHLEGEALAKARGLYSSHVPLDDLDGDEFPAEYEVSADDKARYFAGDREEFPHDIPDELAIRLLWKHLKEDPSRQS